MNFGTFCSGICAPEVAWRDLGWHPQFFSEIEPFPIAVQRHHFPNVPNLGDMERISSDTLGRHPVDLVCAGTPCQAFSVAGLRKGLDDPRGNLTLVFLRLLDQLRPAWVVWENVPGVLSCDGGRAFGAFLGGLGQLGYGFAYRVLDAQHLGVPQRRRRVFVVGYLGDWRRAAAVLFERHSLSGHPAPSREAGERVAGCLSPGAHPGGFNGHAFAGQLITHSLRADGFDASEAFDTTQITSTGNYSNPKPGDPCHPLAAGAHPPAIAFDWQKGGGGADDSFRGKSRSWITRAGDYTGALGATKRDAVSTPSCVRRLTPRECERLQGFPDDWTLVPFRNKPAADGPRYKAIGNSMAVPVMRWIGQRIAAVASLAPTPEAP